MKIIAIVIAFMVCVGLALLLMLSALIFTATTDIMKLYDELDKDN